MASLTQLELWIFGNPVSSSDVTYIGGRLAGQLGPLVWGSLSCFFVLLRKRNMVFQTLVFTCRLVILWTVLLMEGRTLLFPVGSL